MAFHGNLEFYKKTLMPILSIFYYRHMDRKSAVDCPNKINTHNENVYIPVNLKIKHIIVR